MKNNTFQLPADLSRNNLQHLPTSDLGNIAQIRLFSDFVQIKKQSPPGVSVSPRTNDVTTWDAEIGGATKDISFKVVMKFPSNYPTEAPMVRFSREMFHPNIYPDGRFPVNNWSSDQRVDTILTRIQSLLREPDLCSVVNQEAAQLYTENMEEYNLKFLTGPQQFE